jgi:hypothetical protein
VCATIPGLAFKYFKYVALWHLPRVDWSLLLC